MAGYGPPQILDHMNPDFRRAMAINELVGADTMRSTTATVAAARAGDRPMLAPTLDEKPQPLAKKRRGGSRRACNECKQQKVRLAYTLCMQRHADRQ
jgi:hypothetical protein